MYQWYIIHNQIEWDVRLNEKYIHIWLDNMWTLLWNHTAFVGPYFKIL